jgi:ankyrin repeat protein
MVNISLYFPGECTPLHIASYSGHDEAVRMLLENGAEINFTNELGDTALFNAVRGGHVTTVLLLLEHGAVIHGSENVQSGSALHLAVGAGNEAIVLILLDNGAAADCRIKDAGGHTPLGIAVRLDRSAILRILLENDPELDVDIQDRDGYSLLNLAAQWGKTAIAHVLLQRGANVNLPQQDGYTPLHWVSVHSYVDLVKLLLERDHININPQNCDGKTPMALVDEQIQEYFITPHPLGETVTIKELDRLLAVFQPLKDRGGVRISLCFFFCSWRCARCIRHCAGITAILMRYLWRLALSYVVLLELFLHHLGSHNHAGV